MSTAVIAGDISNRGGARRKVSAKAPVLSLVPRTNTTDRALSSETALAFRQMAELAERGEIIGLAYVVLRPNSRVTTGIVGAAQRDQSLVTHWLQKLTLRLLHS